MSKAKSRNLHGLMGMVVLLIAHLLLLQKIEPVASWFYHLAWWSYILIVDSLIYHIKGNSLLMNRRGEFAVLLLWSVAIWTLFEAVNLVIQNWYYVNVIPVRLLRWLGYALAFATVLPGLFETTELLEALGLFKQNNRIPRHISLSMQAGLFSLGVLSLMLVLIFPTYCYPLIWGAFAFLLEPVNYCWGAKSLLREWERGSTRTFLLLMTAGVLCGILWEFWNFWATTKWIYTVPFFEELKLFEMPVLGFLGFPVFAVECFSMYNFISIFRNGRSWEQDSYDRHQQRHVHRGLRMITAVSGVCFCAFTFQAIDVHTVNSFQSRLTELHCIPPESAAAMVAWGIRTPALLVKMTASSIDRETLAKRLSVPPSAMESWRRCAELCELKGMGAWHTNMLIRAGIHDRVELAAQDPSALYARLMRTVDSIDAPHPFPPRQSILNVWIREAQKKSGI